MIQQSHSWGYTKINATQVTPKVPAHTPMFITVLFTIAKLWKQPRCPLLMKESRKCGIYTQWNFTQP
jgi:hypothetical protein